MSIASAIATKQQQVADSYTAVSNKGGTLPATQNLTNLVTAISSIPAGGGGGSETTDVPLTRVSDDNGNEIGTWYMNFENANGNVFKVVLLDAQYRLSSGNWCSDNNKLVTNMPQYSLLNSSNVWKSKETATQNTQLILDYCSANGYTSTACNHCRNKSFSINQTIYYGQMLNVIELFYLAKHYDEFDSLDSSPTSYSSNKIMGSSFRNFWSSTQCTAYDAWSLIYSCTILTTNKTSQYFICPVLEIPNQ